MEVHCRLTDGMPSYTSRIAPPLLAQKAMSLASAAFAAESSDIRTALAVLSIPELLEDPCA